jgi:hypothetical protein
MHQINDWNRTMIAFLLMHYMLYVLITRNPQYISSFMYFIISQKVPVFPRWQEFAWDRCCKRELRFDRDILFNTKDGYHSRWSPVYHSSGGPFRREEKISSKNCHAICSTGVSGRYMSSIWLIIESHVLFRHQFNKQIIHILYYIHCFHV